MGIIAGVWVQGLVFDYFVDDKTGNMVHWSTKVPAFVYNPMDFASLFVPTVETTRLTYLLNLLVSNRHHVMLVGGTGMPRPTLASTRPFEPYIENTDWTCLQLPVLLPIRMRATRAVWLQSPAAQHNSSAVSSQWAMQWDSGPRTHDKQRAFDSPVDCCRYRKDIHCQRAPERHGHRRYDLHNSQPEFLYRCAILAAHFGTAFGEEIG